MGRSKLGADIAWPIAKSLSVGELLKRLRTLATGLSELEQGQVDLDVLRPIAAHFATGELLQHKNKGVTAYAACCVADLLRLSAPDAPFSQSQLKPVFECFIRQLKNLHDTEGAYYAQYFYLLESLATVESVVLVCDLPDKSDALVSDFFKMLFETARDDQRKNTEAHMISILSQLINEAPIVPEAVINLLLAQFRSQPTTSVQQESLNARATRDMASAVCNNCADRLQRNVCQHFTEVICEAAAQADAEHDEIDESALQEVHSLVCELFRAAPTTLQNVVPQLESELNVENSKCRVIATDTISAMLASVNGSLLISQYASTYKAWTSRRNDKSSLVRAAWIQGVGTLLHSSANAARLPDIEKVCIDGLTTKFIDPDEKVRVAACSVIARMPYPVAKDRLTAAVLTQFATRCRDKKQATHAVGMATISGLLQSALPDIVAGDKVARDKFGPLVNDLLHCIYINDADLTVMLEAGLFERVLDAMNDDDRSRTDRLLELVALADDKARKALFVTLGAKQIRNSQILTKYVQVCDKYNGGLMDHNEAQIVKLQSQVHRALAAQFSDPAAAEEDLLQFAKINERRLYKLMQVCLDAKYEHRAICKAYREFRQRAEKISPRVANTLVAILRRSSYLILNRTVMPQIYAAAANRTSRHASAAQELLHVITRFHADLFRSCLDSMIEGIKCDVSDTAIDNLKAFATFARASPQSLPDDVDFVASLKNIVLHAPPKHVKQAVTILCSLPSRDQSAVELTDQITSHLAYGNDNLLSSLSALSQFSLLAASAIEDSANIISVFCLEELLLKNRTEADTSGPELEWLSDELVDEECQAKCLAIRILGNRLRAFSETDTAAEIAQPVFKAFQSIVDNVGEVSRSRNTPPHHRARIRLEVARMMIKLLHFPAYERLLSPGDFNSFALFAQDLEFHVRTSFLTRLQKSLTTSKLSSRFYVILFLAAHDPDEHLQQQALQWAKNHSMGRNAQEFLMESTLPRLVHLLAHHPDFAVDDRDENDLLNFAIYFNFYFDAVVKEESFVLVYHYTQRLKQVADVLSDRDSTGIYILSDVAEAVFAAKAEQNKWPLTTYPKNLKMPRDLFCALKGQAQAAHTQSKPYIDPKIREEIRQKIVKVPKARNTAHQVDDGAVAVEEARQQTVNKKRQRTRSSRQSKHTKSAKQAESSTGRRSSDRIKTAVQYGESASEQSESASSD